MSVLAVLIQILHPGHCQLSAQEGKMCKITEKHLQCSEYEPHAAATFRESQWWYCSHFNSVSTWPTHVYTIYQQHCYRNALQFTFLNFSLLKRYVWSCLPHTFLLPKPVGDPDEDDWQYTSDDKHDGTMCFCHLRRLRLQNSKWWSASGAFGLVRLSVVRRYFCLCVDWYLFEACRGPISETRLVSSCFFLLFLWFLNSSRTKIPRAL